MNAPRAHYTPLNAHLLQSRSFILTLGLLTATAAVTVDLSLPAIPAMVEALGSELSRGQQIVGIFMVGMACGQIPAGLFSDRLGRLPTLYAGMGLFVAVTLYAWLAIYVLEDLRARRLNRRPPSVPESEAPQCS